MGLHIDGKLIFLCDLLFDLIHNFDNNFALIRSTLEKLSLVVQFILVGLAPLLGIVTIFAPLFPILQLGNVVLDFFDLEV